MKKLLLSAAIGSIWATSAVAAPLILEGNYIRVGISDRGTFGSNGGANPGFVHDPTGTGTFNPNFDYVAPGTPHDGFSLISDQFGFTSNDNTGISGFGSASPTFLTGLAAEGYANAATWSGGNRFLTITNSYFFNDGDERIIVRSVITALSDLTSLAFARSVDPDSDSRAHGTASTNNQRGNSLFSADDFVGSAGSVSGRTLALVNLDTDGYAHTTQINGDCCSNINPYDVLGHTGDDQGLSSTGDHGLNLAYRLGALKTGASITLDYAYAVGAKIETTGGGGGTGAVPEPATWAMMLAGFGLMGASMRRKQQGKVRFAF